MRPVTHDDYDLAAIRRSPWRAFLPLLLLTMGLSANQYVAAGEATPDTQSPPDWVHDALVVTMPAAAVGGCQAGIYTPADNGVRPWRQALIRWVTSRNVRGNAAVLVRQEGPEGGAGLSAIVDPRAEYLFEVSVYSPSKGNFGDEGQDKDLQIWVTVLDANDRVLAAAPVKLIPGDWAPGQVSFASGPSREVRCVVQAKTPQRPPCIYFVEGFRLTRKDYAWWNPQNLFNASRTAVRLRDEREHLIQTLDPDVVAGHNGVYLNWDGFFTQRGIAVGGGQWEQEYNHLAVDDPVVDQFRDDGMARDLDGKEIHGRRLWPGFYMCQNAPGWHSYYRQRLTRVAPEVQLLAQDNICNPSFLGVGGEKVCFCRWCRDGFRHWLRQGWAAEQFHAAGISDPAALDIAEYVKKVQESRIAKGRDAVLADPVLRAYIQFQYASQADRWRDSVAAVKQAAGHPIAVCGNQYGSGGTRPYSVTLSQISDVTLIETGAGPLTLQKRAWDVLASKLGLAAGEYRRPVWLCLSSLLHVPQAAQSQLRMVDGQAWADGSVPMPWATAAGASGWFYDTEARMCRFVQRHRALYARRDRCANVGLVYSLPTHAWREFPTFGFSSAQYQQWFVACAQLLEEAHVPYEVNCWWHPLLGDDRVSLERLARYQVLILPGVDCFTDAQREAVRVFQARGGRVISVACPTLYDADAVPRSAGQTLAAPGERLFEIKPDVLTRYAHASEKPSPETAAEALTAAKEMQAIVFRAVAEDRMLVTDAPSDVWANVWLDDTRQVLALHLVNGNIDMKADRFRPVEGSRWRVHLPATLAVTEALFISPDEPSATKPLSVEVANGWATVIVPRIESYTIVALFSRNALTAADNVAKARRTLWQASVARGGQTDVALDAQLEKVLSLLRSGQLDAGARAAADLARRSGADAIRPAAIEQ